MSVREANDGRCPSRQTCGFAFANPVQFVLLPAPVASCRPQTSGGDSKNPNLIIRWWGSDLSLLTAPKRKSRVHPCSSFLILSAGREATASCTQATRRHYSTCALLTFLLLCGIIRKNQCSWRSDQPRSDSQLHACYFAGDEGHSVLL